jgi:4-azaleucine resistance transporter AzlC
MQTQSRRFEFFRGVRDELPILLGVIPFGLIFGTLAIHNGLSSFASQATSSVIFAGSAQFIAVQLIGSGASAAVILMVVFIVNLRHALYSASVAPHINHLKPGWKYLLAYLLTDEAYIVAITHYDNQGISPTRHWYFLGAGLTLWSAWQASTAAGILVGGQIGQNWPLSFALPLTFIGLVVPGLKDRPMLAAAVSAGVVGLLAAALPYKLGLLLAAIIGISVGMLLERYQK